MIVKNEAHLIERCLRSVRAHVDSWAIVDTGSTDGTQDVVRALLADRPGELIERPWVDFAHARNQALRLARDYGDYALVIDADDVLEADAGFSWGALGAPGYALENLQDAHGSWWRVQLMQLGLDWAWEGVVHELPVSVHSAEAWKARLMGARIRVLGGGARSRQSPQQRCAQDIEALRAALVETPDHPRCAFCLAQTLREAGRWQEAIEAYERRVRIGGWFEEVYASKFQIAVLRERVGAGYDDVLAAYLDAYDYRPQRAEAPCELARHTRNHERYAVAYVFARIACSIERPEDRLDVDPTVYLWRARDELALAAYFVDDYDTCIGTWRELLADPRLPSTERGRVETNLEAALEAASAEALTAAGNGGD
jgi:glycosyltransferase involved in cell wall biosynthesis